MKLGLLIDYYCENGAYHTNNCCYTCWNKHPNCVKGEMFKLSDEFKKVLKEDFLTSARKAGFTKKQALFLSK